MTVVATATVKINADIRDLKKGLTEAEKSAEKMQASFNRMRGAAAQVRADAMASQIRMLDPFQKTAVAADKTAGAIGRVAAASGAATLPTRQLATSFAGMAANMAGLPSVIGRVAATLGTFAAGGPIAVGAAAGLALIAVGYSKIKGAAEEAKKANEDFIASLAGMVNAANQIGLEERARLIERGQPSDGASAFPQTAGGSPVFKGSLLDMKAERATLMGQPYQGRRIAALDVKIAAAERQLAEVTERLMNPLTTPAIGALTATINAKRDKAKKPFDVTKGMPDVTGMVNFQMDRVLARGLNPQDWLDQRIQGQATAPFQMKPMQPMKSNLELRAMSDVPVKLDSLGQRLQTGLASVSGELLSGLTNIAMQMAFVGGKGKGSQVGGWAGGLLGMGMGGLLGGTVGKLGLGGPIGMIMGTIGGSLLGGLFDKKKKVANGLDLMATQLARVNQQLRNMPSGYKVNRMQYDATVPENTPTSPGRPGGGGTGPSGPGIPGEGGIIVYGNIQVMANSATQMVRDLGRAVVQEGTRGGVTGLAWAGG